MVNPELTTSVNGHGDDSTYSSDLDSAMDTNHDQDIVEDFARTLDRRKISNIAWRCLASADYGLAIFFFLVVLQQAETNQDESSDESDMEAFGYEQLPQDYNEDDDNDDAGYHEQQEQEDEGNLRDTSDESIMHAGKPDPVRFEITEDVNIPEGGQSIFKTRNFDTFMANNEELMFRRSRVYQKRHVQNSASKTW
jgi:hypothetical protein